MNDNNTEALEHDEMERVLDESWLTPIWFLPTHWVRIFAWLIILGSLIFFIVFLNQNYDTVAGLSNAKLALAIGVSLAGLSWSAFLLMCCGVAERLQELTEYFTKRADND